MDFFEEVKRLAKQQNTTIESVCKRAFGDKQSSIDKYYGWSKRDLWPRMDDGHLIASVLGVSMDHFFESENSRNQKITDLLSEFSDAELQDIEVMLEMMISKKK